MVQCTFPRIETIWKKRKQLNGKGVLSVMTLTSVITSSSSSSLVTLLTSSTLASGYSPETLSWLLLLSQGLGTSCNLCLECSSPQICPRFAAPSPSSDLHLNVTFLSWTNTRKPSAQAPPVYTS